MKLPAGVTGTADFSPCGRYRYRLSRAFREAPRAPYTVCFCGLNPSKADADEDDATIRKLCGYARRWGFQRLLMVNLYGWIETRSTKLFDAAEPRGNSNTLEVMTAAIEADRFVACWGATPPQDAEAGMLDVLTRAGIDVWAFKLTTGGRPCHPLYLRNDTEPFLWRPASSGAAS